MFEPRLIPTNIGTRKQVFLDQSFIAAGYGVGWKNSAKPTMMPRGIDLEVHSPTVAEDPIFAMPGQIFGGSSLLCEEGKLKLYYGSMSVLTGEEAEVSSKLHYAESADGRSWTLPSLGFMEWKGSRENNIIFMEDPAKHQYPPRGATVFRDPTASPEERYKFVYCWEYREGESIFRPAVRGAVSPDGLRWEAIPDVLLWHRSDAQNVVQYDEDARLYRGYFRDLYPRKSRHGLSRRVIRQAVTTDFRHWPDTSLAVMPNPLDPPDLDFYDNAYVRWPGAQDAHLMFPTAYLRSPDTMEIHMACSRDGSLWFRPQQGPILSNGAPGTSHDCGFNSLQGIGWLQGDHVASSPDTADRWIMLVESRRTTHNQANYPEGASRQTNVGPHLASIRPDGFMSVSARNEGEFWTQEFVFSGENLLLNSWARFGGYIAVEILQDGVPVKGFALAECDVVREDSLWKPVSWCGKSEVGSLAGTTCQLRFFMVRARLYAFRFAKRNER